MRVVSYIQLLQFLPIGSAGAAPDHALGGGQVRAGGVRARRARHRRLLRRGEPPRARHGRGARGGARRTAPRLRDVRHRLLHAQVESGAAAEPVPEKVS